MQLRLDCRHFRGEKPCRFGRLCEGCPYYEPMGTRILVIKLDAVGDVARTTTILRPLRERYRPCHITWLVAPAAEEMLRGNSLIDVLLPYTSASLETLHVQRFDLVLSLDKTPRATAVAMQVRAREKLGFGLSEYGTAYPLNEESEYAFRLGLDDNLKFRRNNKTYQEIIFQCARLPYNREEYAIEIDDDDRRYADSLLSRLGVTSEDPLVGLNMGGGEAFANKMWDADTAVRFLRRLTSALRCNVLLFGAAREAEAISRVMEARIPGVHETGTRNTIRQFQALLGRCDVVVTGDSLGMHLAIAERRPVVVLFGPTCPQEIELYGRGEKIVSTVDCAPCYRSRCSRSPTCMEAIEPERVVEAVRRLLPR